jgi:hypothetical protein
VAGYSLEPLTVAELEALRVEIDRSIAVARKELERIETLLLFAKLHEMDGQLRSRQGEADDPLKTAAGEGQSG